MKQRIADLFHNVGPQTHSFVNRENLLMNVPCQLTILSCTVSKKYAGMCQVYEKSSRELLGPL